MTRGVDLGGDRGGRSLPKIDVGETETLISPPKFLKSNKNVTKEGKVGIGYDEIKQKLKIAKNIKQRS